MPNPSPGRLFFFTSVLLCFVASDFAEIYIDGNFLGNTRHAQALHWSA